MSRTDLRTRASWIAREHDVVVFPTPPLPPTKIHRRVFCEIMDSSVGSRVSVSVSMVAAVAADMVVSGAEWSGARALGEGEL